MSKVKVARKIHEGHTPEAVWHGKASEMIGYQEMGCHPHMITLYNFLPCCYHFLLVLVSTDSSHHLNCTSYFACLELGLFTAWE
jgi:hypothetical protein